MIIQVAINFPNMLINPPSNSTQDLEAELNSHESVIEGLEARGQELITNGHFASDTIKESKRSVHDTWTKLQEATTQRTKMLNDSLDAQEVCYVM